VSAPKLRNHPYGAVSEYIGGRLKAARHVKGWTQGEAAHHAGMHQARLGTYERGERTIPAVVAWRLANLYGVPVGFLYPPPETPPSGAIADLTEVTS
jgi:transcriptional regulator with XRE-family HTH domain